MEHIDFTLVDWSRAQFALTALYHWIFVPLTLGLTWIIAIMATIYYRTGDEKWKTITKFWLKLFGINFAVGVATGLILEFEFGTNWSAYSWFVGDIFGAPLAVEGIMAFFLESTFIAVLFFGWNRVGKGLHLTSAWLVAVGANLSALWILVANAWMQDPVGMVFNPETARNEMYDFWAILFSPTAINKFFHTVLSGYVTAGVFVVGVSSWLLLKKKNVEYAAKSLRIGAIFGLIGIVLSIWTGDGSGRRIFEIQPMKLAAAEGLVYGQKEAPLTVIGYVSTDKEKGYKGIDVKGIKVPGMLSLLSDHKFHTFVPGVNDLIEGNPEHGIMSAYEKMERGAVAQKALSDLKDMEKGSLEYHLALEKFADPQWQKDYFSYFGYGYFYNKNPEIMQSNAQHLVPNVPLIFYSFRAMVGLGCLFLLLFAVALYLSYKKRLEGKRWFFYAAIAAIPLVYVCSMAGWVVAEVGRQPWIIESLMPTMGAVSDVKASSVQTTFWIFACTFTVLLIAEVKIMISQIKKGMTPPTDNAPGAPAKNAK